MSNSLIEEDLESVAKDLQHKDLQTNYLRCERLVKIQVARKDLH